MEPKQTMTPEEAAAVLTCSTEHVNLLCRQGKIKAKKPFGRWIINREHVMELAGLDNSEIKVEEKASIVGEKDGKEHQGEENLDI